MTTLLCCVLLSKDIANSNCISSTTCECLFMQSRFQILQPLTDLLYHKMPSFYFQALREDYKWPATPPNFSNKQQQLWQTALQTVFVVGHPNKNKRKLRPSSTLGLWTGTKVIQKWTTFFFREEDQIYKRAGFRWLVYTSAGGRNTRSWNYIKSDTSTLSLPSSTNQLASICPKQSRYAIKSSTPWELSELDDNLLLFNTTPRPFSLVTDAFEALVDSSRILIDHFVLPKDNCQLIATAISDGW